MMILPLALATAILGQQTPPIQPKLTPVATPPEVEFGQDLAAVNVSGDEAAKIAVLKSPKLALARALYRNAQGKAIDAGSGLRPTFAVGSGNGSVANAYIPINRNADNAATTAGILASATVKQLLFDFGHTLATAKQALANEKAAYHAVNRSEQDLVFATKQAYYVFVQNTGLVTVAESNVKDRQAQLDLAKARFNAGPGEPSDVLLAQTNLAEATQQLVLARNTAMASRIALALVMGIDPRTPIAPSTSEEPAVTSDFSALLKDALTNRPDLLQSIQQLRAAGYEVRAAETNDAPSINLSAGYTTKGLTNITANQSAAVALSINWLLYDGGHTRGTTLAAQADRDTAQLNLESTQLTIGSDVATAFTNLQYSEQRLPITESELTNAKESLRIAQGRFQAGLGQFLDVTNAEANLVTAQQAVVTAQSNVAIARANLRHAVGM